jgi:hypothetical protein
LNTIALNRFFKNDIQDPAERYFLPDLFQEPTSTYPDYPSTPSALFVHHLQDFNFVLGRNTKTMCEQVADLCVLATRLHSMTIFSLSFPYVDKYFLLTEMQTFTSTAADMGFEHVTRLLDTA